jgi:hypothetical protein
MAKDIVPYKFNAPAKRYKIKPKKIGIMAKAGKGFKKVGKAVGSVIKKGIRLSGAGLALTGAGYVAGASSRRYAKAPKPGEGRNLRDMVLDQPSKRTYYL